MQKTISARFDSVDAAERAAARLKQHIGYLHFENAGKNFGSTPADAPLTASVYYPWRLNMSMGELNSTPQELGSRVVFTSDIMGLPAYRDEAASLRFRLDAGDVPRARAMLINTGGTDIRIS